MGPAPSPPPPSTFTVQVEFIRPHGIISYSNQPNGRWQWQRRRLGPDDRKIQHSEWLRTIPWKISFTNLHNKIISRIEFYHLTRPNGTHYDCEDHHQPTSTIHHYLFTTTQPLTDCLSAYQSHSTIWPQPRTFNSHKPHKYNLCIEQTQPEIHKSVRAPAQNRTTLLISHWLWSPRPPSTG